MTHDIALFCIIVFGINIFFMRHLKSVDFMQFYMNVANGHDVIF